MLACTMSCSARIYEQFNSLALQQHTMSHTMERRHVQALPWCKLVIAAALSISICQCPYMILVMLVLLRYFVPSVTWSTDKSSQYISRLRAPRLLRSVSCLLHHAC